MEIKPTVRNEYGLITGINYIQTPEGLIDWRKMLKPEFIVPNRKVFEKAKLPVPTSIDGLEDKDLVILLAGIKYLARLRGYTKVSPVKIVSPCETYVIAAVEITWIPNFETEGREVTSMGVGDANPMNTNEMGRKYLAPFAENRAFIRCVRNFLNVNIVGQEEIGTVPEEVVSALPQASAAALLESAMAEKNVTWEQIKSKLVQEGIEGADSFVSVADIPKLKIFDLLNRVKAKKP